MIEDPLSGLSLFLVVAEKRSFTAAAKAMRVSPSAVSQAISALEQRLGVRLLQRTTRDVGLTEAGEQFVARLRPALSEVHGALASLDELRDRPAGTLRLAVSTIACRRFVEPSLTAFLDAYPEIGLEVIVDDGLTNIVQRGFDAGIRLGESLDREMVGVRISGDERVAVVGSPSYFARHKKPKHPRELHEHDCIGYRRITGGDVYRWEFTENGRDFDVAVRGRLVANDGALMVRAAIDGLGLAHVLESMVETELAEKRLVRVLAEFCPPFPGYFLYYPSRTHLAPKLRALVDFLRVRSPARRVGRRARATSSTDDERR